MNDATDALHPLFRLIGAFSVISASVCVTFDYDGVPQGAGDDIADMRHMVKSTDYLCNYTHEQDGAFAAAVYLIYKAHCHVSIHVYDLSHASLNAHLLIFMSPSLTPRSLITSTDPVPTPIVLPTITHSDTPSISSLLPITPASNT